MMAELGTKDDRRTSSGHSIAFMSAISHLRAADSIIQPDVVIRLDTTSFDCHKLVLLLNSSYFCKYFPIHQLQINVTEIEIPVAECQAPVFRKLLDYIYTGTIFLRGETVEDIYNAADRFQLSDLKVVCVEYMVSILGKNNCIRY